MQQSVVNSSNAYYDADMNVVSISNVQQVGDRGLYRRANRWIDSRIAARAAEAPARTIDFGTPEFAALLTRFASEGRASVFANRGETLLEVDGDIVLVRLPTEP